VEAGLIVDDLLSKQEKLVFRYIQYYTLQDQVPLFLINEWVRELPKRYSHRRVDRTKPKMLEISNIFNVRKYVEQPY